MPRSKTPKEYVTGNPSHSRKLTWDDTVVLISHYEAAGVVSVGVDRLIKDEKGNTQYQIEYATFWVDDELAAVIANLNDILNRSGEI